MFATKESKINIKPIKKWHFILKILKRLYESLSITLQVSINFQTTKLGQYGCVSTISVSSTSDLDRSCVFKFVREAKSRRAVGVCKI